MTRHPRALIKPGWWNPLGMMSAQTNGGCNDVDRSAEVPDEALSLSTPSRSSLYPPSFCTFSLPPSPQTPFSKITVYSAKVALEPQ